MAAPLDHLQSAFGEVMSEQPVSHSPLPWRVLNVTAVVSERDVRGPTIAQCWPAYDNAVSNANAEFIVPSCNAHHKLLTLAEKIVMRVTGGPDQLQIGK